MYFGNLAVNVNSLEPPSSEPSGEARKFGILKMDGHDSLHENGFVEDAKGIAVGCPAHDVFVRWLGEEVVERKEEVIIGKGLG